MIVDRFTLHVIHVCCCGWNYVKNGFHEDLNYQIVIIPTPNLRGTFRVFPCTKRLDDAGNTDIQMNTTNPDGFESPDFHQIGPLVPILRSSSNTQIYWVQYGKMLWFFGWNLSFCVRSKQKKLTASTPTKMELMLGLLHIPSLYDISPSPAKPNNEDSS